MRDKDLLNQIGDEKRLKEKPRLEYSQEEEDYRAFLIKRLTKAENDRNDNHIEFDDQDYVTYHETNAKAANSYIPPKKNKQDTRIVTGTTHEKEITLWSALLNYNLEPNIEAYSEKDLPINELGNTIEDLIKKSREIEKYDDKRVLIYK
jgi:hypothetical protein